jgi:hypothetical protein
MGWWLVLGIQVALCLIYELARPRPVFEDEDTAVPHGPTAEPYVPLPDSFDWVNLVGVVIVIGVPALALYYLFQALGWI